MPSLPGWREQEVWLTWSVFLPAIVPRDSISLIYILLRKRLADDIRTEDSENRLLVGTWGRRLLILLLRSMGRRFRKVVLEFLRMGWIAWLFENAVCSSEYDLASEVSSESTLDTESTESSSSVSCRLSSCSSNFFSSSSASGRVSLPD